uniref:Putative product n=1 Tax=Xenopsylla cheopis TaxID=163159 RepID=A0A6M2DYW0_XENCH
MCLHIIYIHNFFFLFMKCIFIMIKQAKLLFSQECQTCLKSFVLLIFDFFNQIFVTLFVIPKLIIIEQGPICDKT